MHRVLLTYSVLWVVSLSACQISGPGCESCSDHYLDLFHYIPRVFIRHCRSENSPATTCTQISLANLEGYTPRFPRGECSQKEL